MKTFSRSFPPFLLLLVVAVLGLTVGCGSSKQQTTTTPKAGLLTPGQEVFAARLSQQTGLNQAVVAAWVLAESSGSAAQSRQKRGDNNWLNLGMFDQTSATNSTVKAEFKTPISAADYTAQQMSKIPAGKKILASAGGNAQQQLQAIAGSSWASSGYNNGASLRAALKQLRAS